jgi:thiaminase/transcriptional activator TenA
LSEASPPEDRRYADWIVQYASEEFEEALDWLRSELDRLAVGASEEKRARLHEIFLTSTRYEWMFWEMCWSGETWSR